MSSHVQSHMARAAWRFLDGTIVFEVHQDAFGKFKKKKKRIQMLGIIVHFSATFQRTLLLNDG